MLAVYTEKLYCMVFISMDPLEALVMKVPTEEVALSIRIGPDTPRPVLEALTDLLRALRDSPEAVVLEKAVVDSETRFFDLEDLCTYFQSHASTRSQALDQARRVYWSLIEVRVPQLMRCGRCSEWRGVCRCHGFNAAGKSQPERWVYDFCQYWHFSIPATRALQELDLRNFSKVSRERLRAFVAQLPADAEVAA